MSTGTSRPGNSNKPVSVDFTTAWPAILYYTLLSFFVAGSAVIGSLLALTVYLSLMGHALSNYWTPPRPQQVFMPPAQINQQQPAVPPGFRRLPNGGMQRIPQQPKKRQF